MNGGGYFSQVGGLPLQTQTLSSKAVFTTAYAVIPKTVMSDIVTSVLPHWEKTRAWIISRPLSGFAETFAQYIMEVAPGGGSVKPEPDARAQGAIFVVEGEGTIIFEGDPRPLRTGSFAYLPADAQWALQNDSAAPIRFHWVRKVFKVVEGLDPPPAVFTHEDECVLDWMPDTNETWGTTRFLDPSDLRHDFHMNIVTFEPGASIPFMETHIMEHGLYVLEGKAVYRLNSDWVEVEAGDYMWLRAYCPQACYAAAQDASVTCFTRTSTVTLTYEDVSNQIVELFDASGRKFLSHQDLETTTAARKQAVVYIRAAHLIRSYAASQT